MQHAKLQRFDFGSLRDFRAPLDATPKKSAVVEEAPPPPPPPPVYNEAQYIAAQQDAEKRGYQKGFLAGEAEEKSRQNAQASMCEQSLIALGQHLRDLDQRYAATLAAQSRFVSELALVIAKKVAAPAIATQAETIILSLVENCLPVILAKPRVMMELHPDTLHASETRIRAYLTSERYEGEMLFYPNNNLALGDARIDWVQGHAERNTNELWASIEALISTMQTPITLHTAGEENGR